MIFCAQEDLVFQLADLADVGILNVAFIGSLGADRFDRQLIVIQAVARIPVRRVAIDLYQGAPCLPRLIPYMVNGSGMNLSAIRKIMFPVTEFLIVRGWNV